MVTEAKLRLGSLLTNIIRVLARVDTPAGASSLLRTWKSKHTNSLVSPASLDLLGSQHGCIASPHAKKESGQTPLAVWSPLVQEFLGPGSGFDCCGVWFYSSLLTVRPHLLTVQDQTANGV